MTTSIALDPKQYGLDEKKAEQMTSGLVSILSERDILSGIYLRVINQELNGETLDEARSLRLKIRDNRTKGIEAWHKTNKEFYLRGGQFVDAIKKVQVLENERMEDALLGIEKYFENKEKERQQKLHDERIVIISQYVDDITGLDFRAMADDVFEAFVSAKKIAQESRIEAERIAEEQRLEAIRIETERIEAQRVENERLKKEAAEKEMQLQKEREESAKAMQEAIAEQQRLAKIEQDKQASILAKQKEETDRIFYELKAEQDRQAKKQKEREAAELAAKKEAEKLAKAPIKKQLQAWVKEFSISPIPEHDTAVLIANKFDAFKLWALKEIDTL